MHAIRTAIVTVATLALLVVANPADAARAKPHPARGLAIPSQHISLPGPVVAPTHGGPIRIIPIPGQPGGVR